MHEVLGGQIFTPCFYPKHFWEQINGEIWILSHISVPMHGYRVYRVYMHEYNPPFWQVNGTNPAPDAYSGPHTLYSVAEVFHMLFLTTLNH